MTRNGKLGVLGMGVALAIGWAIGRFDLADALGGRPAEARQPVELAQLPPPPGEAGAPADPAPAKPVPPRGGEPAAIGRQPRPALPDEDLSPDERINVRVYEQCNRSVVNITTKAMRADNMFMFETPQEGSGSGSVLDKLGHVLTNYHVIEGAQQILVTLYDGRAYAAKLVGQDPSTDIAVVKIEAPADSLFPVTFGDSSRLRVGQNAFAIGNPFGLERTFSTGVISSLNRTLPARNRRQIKSIIQIDAAINPGNSGGPLLDGRGRLIGMNTAIASKTGQSAGVGFAIPVGTIARIVPQLTRVGRVVRPDLGIARMAETENGLLVVIVTPDGPADKAGIQGFRLTRERRQIGPFVEERQRVDRSRADTIIAVDSQKVGTQDQFWSIIESKKPGDEVELSLLREGGKRARVMVRLGTDEG